MQVHAAKQLMTVPALSAVRPGLVQPMPTAGTNELATAARIRLKRCLLMAIAGSTAAFGYPAVRLTRIKNPSSPMLRCMLLGTKPIAAGAAAIAEFHQAVASLGIQQTAPPAGKNGFCVCESWKACCQQRSQPLAEESAPPCRIRGQPLPIAWKTGFTVV